MADAPKDNLKATPGAAPPHRDEALVERFFRRVFESMGSAVDRRFGRDTGAAATSGGVSLSTTAFLERMKRSIDENVYIDSDGARIAPHLMNLRVEWGTHSEAPPDAFREIEHEVLAAAINHINDNRYRTLAPVRVETATDIFTTGVNVVPTFGEFAAEVEAIRARAREEAETGDNKKTKNPKAAGSIGQAAAQPGVRNVEVKLTIGESRTRATVQFTPGGRRVNVGRASGNELRIDHPSVSKIHAALRMNADGSIVVADTGSTNGTSINGRRIAYGEARTIEAGDTVSFGDCEARFSEV